MPRTYSQVRHHATAPDTQFLVQPKAIELKPEVPTQKPIARVQTATVVAPDGEEIDTDEYGRIKVKFHWDKPSLQDRRLFEPLEVKDINTCWLRVSTAWAGENYGAIQLPRAGQEVIVDFFGGDPNMPFVSGRLTNPDNMPVWQLPNEKVLSGLKSKEYQGSQSNQLVMDDTTGKLQVQLKSDHQSSELNLGSITRINPVQGRADFRGEGFELRTDGHGVVRADKGLILTSFGKQQAQSYVKDMNEVTPKLTSSFQIHQSFLKLAKLHEVNEDSLHIEVAEQLKQDIDEIKGGDKPIRQGELSAPHLVLSSPTSITLSADKQVNLMSQKNTTLTAQGDVSIATAKRLLANVAQGMRVLVQNLGIKLFAARGKIEIQAQSDNVEVVAEQVLKLLSAKSKIEMVADKEILITSNGSYIKISKEGIELGSPKLVKIHAPKHELLGAKEVSYKFDGSPVVGVYDEKFVLQTELGELVNDIPYKIINKATGEELTGVTDEEGGTVRTWTESEQEVEFDLDFLELIVENQEEEL